MTQSKKSFENIAGKEENAGNNNVSTAFIFLYVNALNLDQFKILSRVNRLPKNKIFDRSKLKALADDKMNMMQNSKFVLGKVENIMGKGENTGYQYFLLFLQCFHEPSASVSIKVGIVW